MLKNPSEAMRRLVGLTHPMTLILATDEDLSLQDLRDLEQSLEEMFFICRKEHPEPSHDAGALADRLLSLRLQE